MNPKLTSYMVQLRRKYLDDYVTCLEDEEDEQLQNLVVLCGRNDPLTYDEAVKPE